ncbi:MAG: hypothetical protein LBN97_07705 [Oscillospiraceae bacterium]|nr:hypothetical protein [Oscillospiraceae bacterium]
MSFARTKRLLSLVYGDKLRVVYPTKQSADYLEASGIRFAVVDVEQDQVDFLNVEGEIIASVRPGEPIGNPGLIFKLRYYLRHIWEKRESFRKAANDE